MFTKSKMKESSDSAVGIATICGLNGRGVEFESLHEQDSSKLHVVQTGTGV
jgi:hypothetical protein